MTKDVSAAGDAGVASPPTRSSGPGGSAEGATTPIRLRKVSVTLPEHLVARARQRVGQRGLSGYLARALEHEERREDLAEFLAAAEAAHGPIPQEAIEEVKRRWPAARAVL